MSFSVAPGCLIAMPNLLDPNFFRSVVALCAHNAEGAFGLVINQPLDVSMDEVCAESGVPWFGGDDARVFTGGPVERQRGWLLHRSDRHFEGTQHIVDGLGMTPSRDGLEAYGSDPAGPYRLVLGYSGWGAGQLDQEIAHGSWLTAPLDAALVFDVAPEDVWARALASVGVDPAHLVDGGSQIN